MKKFSFITKLIIVFIALTSISCSEKRKPPQTDQEYMGAGDYYMEKEFYDEARKYYLKVKTDFPNTPLQAEASLKIADSYFREGSYQTASESYEDFIRTFPGHTDIPTALYKLGMSSVKQMPSVPSRDTRATEKAIESFTRLIMDYPNDSHIPEAQKWVNKGNEIMAKKILHIANFYKKQKEYKAAARRYAELMTKYPESKQARESWKDHLWVLRRAGEEISANVLEEEYRQKYANP